MLGFLLSNAGASGSVQQFVITIDALEQQTGIDFFPQLDDALEQSLESKVSLSGWKFEVKILIRILLNNVVGSPSRTINRLFPKPWVYR